MCVGTAAPVYSPVFLFQTPQGGVGDHGSWMRERGFALGSDPKPVTLTALQCHWAVAQP